MGGEKIDDHFPGDFIYYFSVIDEKIAMLRPFVFACLFFFVLFSIKRVFCVEQLHRLDELYDQYSYPLKEPINGLLQALEQQDTTGVQLSPCCATYLKKLSIDIERGEDEAIAMLDSFTHQRPGEETGLIYDTGDQSQCEDITSDGSRGKYHLLRVTYPSSSVEEAQEQLPGIDKSPLWTDQIIWNSVTIRYIPKLFGICLPASCTKQDIQSVLESPFFVNSTHPLAFTVMMHRMDDQLIFSGLTILSYGILLALLAANVIGSLFPTGYSMFSHFNLRHNLNSLMRPPSHASTQFISKFKLMYILACNMNHIVVPVIYHSIYPLIRPFYMATVGSELVRQLFYEMASIMNYSVVMSSSLALMSWYPILSKGKVNFTQFFMMRALRSIPVVLFSALVIIVSSGFNAHSPLMKHWLETSSSNCMRNGWLELTFLSNLADADTLCHRVTWLVSADMQLYAASFLLMVYLSRNHDHRRTTKLMLMILCILCVLSLLAALPHAWHIPIAVKHASFFFEDPARMLQTYFNTVQYSVPYVSGLWIAYYMAIGYQWPSRRVTCLIATSVFLYLCFIISLPMRSENKLIISLLHLLRMVATSSAACLLFFALWSRQHLNSKRVTPSGYISTVISRTQYPFFLIHPLVITYLSLSFSYQFYTSLQIFLMIFPLQFIVSFFLAVIVHLTVECPFASMLNSCIKSKMKSSVEETDSKSILTKQEASYNDAYLPVASEET